jgi:hypothetical protein
MRSITAGSSIAVMIFRLAPHRGQRSISMSNTRFSNRAQPMRAGVPGACAQSVARPDVALAEIGTIAARSPAWGASTP